MSKGYSGLFKLTKGDYANYEIKYESSSKVKDKREPDFYVGLNNVVLDAKYKKYIGVSRRNHFLKIAKNRKLKSAINELFRKGSYIGDGGTASALKLEKAMGLKFEKNKGHYKKANDFIIHLDRLIKNENLNQSDLKLAKKLRNKLIRTVRGIDNGTK